MDHCQFYFPGGQVYNYINVFANGNIDGWCWTQPMSWGTTNSVVVRESCSFSQPHAAPISGLCEAIGGEPRPIVSTPSPHTVFTRGLEEELEAPVRKLVSEIVTPAVRCSVQVTNYNRQVPLPAVDDFFYIFLCASPGRGSGIRACQAARDQFASSERWFSTSGAGYSIDRRRHHIW